MHTATLVSCLLIATATLPCQAATCGALLSPMAFGIYDSILPAANDTVATVTVSCTPGLSQPLTTSYTITIAGTGTGNDAVRAMSSGAYKLYYQVYKNAARTTVWGNGGTSGTGVASSVTSLTTVTPGLQVHNVYARMPPLQAIPPGIYIGSLLVTIDY
ncbi:Spore coat protein U (SCPU) domain-containing protein [Rhodoferax sp. OV413]|uniref:spore coat protein U domain-containing protein n=1 Tax=Rhodoferax sp. OV413 TaxID=1855285 RepID=UPI0008885942|nr:spore coat protein U domain-containing protein [Rhodoferax sp. OV413]SDP83543.1 Spore coat protein U (SCPU) domain-containing protein [Rhodoferax sp. OV413]